MIVIGAGAAGMMASITAAEAGANVTLLEKNDALGRKLLITGNGRCNLTNTREGGDFISGYFQGGQFLRDAIKALPPEGLLGFFRKRGVEFKVEEDGKVFPVTDRAADIVDTLKSALNETGVNVLCGSRVRDIKISDGMASGVILANGKEFQGGAVVLASGGLSYGSTGSSGDGYPMAENAGHRIIGLRPGLVALNTEEDMSCLEGLSVEDVIVSFVSGRKKVRAGRGSLIFTRKGVSGPVIISSSAKIIDAFESGPGVRIELNFCGGSNVEEVSRELTAMLAASPNKDAVRIVGEFVPRRLAELITARSGIGIGIKANMVKKEARAEAARELAAFPMTIVSSRPMEEAMVTRGGVSLKEIDPRTMASRIVKGLFLAGEIIDVDGDTGGFNLQAAFSTGFLAGRSAALIVAGR